jgi:hypothetical protein
MKNLKITWDNPASTSGIDELHVYRKSGDHTVNTDYDLFRSGATLVANVSTNVEYYVDAQVPVGSYTYGVFSHNSSGYGPGDLANTVFDVSPDFPIVSISSTVGFRDYTSLVFDHTLTRQDGTDMDESLAGVQYEFKIATDNQMVNVVDTITKASLVNGADSGLSYISREPFTNLTPNTTYFSQLTITGAHQGQSSIVESATNPCAGFNATRTSDGDGTHTIDITTTPGATVTLTEELVSPGLRGHMRPVLNDEFGNLFIGIAEGSFRGDGDNGGKLVLDGGMPKFASYVPDEIPYNSYGGNLWWAPNPASAHAAGGDAIWTTAMRDFLQGGGDIYDGTVPGQAAYLLNVFNFTKRIDNPTNKILFINDYKDGATGASAARHEYYGAAKFVSVFKDVAEYGGFTLEQLDDTIDQTTFLYDHSDALLNKYSTAADWLTFLNGYDLVVYVGIEGPNPSVWNGGTGKYLTQAFIDGMLDFYDGGGGLFATTDHENFTQGSVNQLVYNYGVQFTGNIDRTSGDAAYKVSNILSQNDYVQYGSHPLFNNLDPESFLFASTSEGMIAYNSGQFPAAPQVSRTSEFTADANGSVSVGAHVSGNAIENRKLIISTSNGCGTTLDAI